MARPGVETRIIAQAASSSGSGTASGRYFVAGLFARGRTDAPVVVRSLQEVRDTFGPRPGYSAAWDSLRVFFDEGGSSACVLRVVGPAGAVGTTTLKDDADVDTMRIDAVGAGAWSAGVSVQVLAGTLAGSVKLLIGYGEDIEAFDNITTVAQGVAKLNASTLVRGADLGSITPAPGDLPAIAAAAPLSAGVDDRAAVTASTMTNALDLFSPSLGVGAVALPGYAADLVGAALRAHASDTSRVAILATAVGADTTSTITLANTLRSAEGQYTMLVYPWIVIDVAPGVTVATSAEGYVAAARARAHDRSGPWAAAAGEGSTARRIVGIEREIPEAEREKLNEAGVSALRAYGGRIQLFGYRSLAIDVDNFAMISAQDTLNWLSARCEEAVQKYVFAPITGTLLALVGGSLVDVCASAADGLFPAMSEDVPPRMIDPGYLVDVGNGINTPASLATNTLRASVGVRLAPYAELVQLDIIKIPLASA